MQSEEMAATPLPDSRPCRWSSYEELRNSSIIYWGENDSEKTCVGQNDICLLSETNFENNYVYNISYFIVNNKTITQECKVTRNESGQRKNVSL